MLDEIMRLVRTFRNRDTNNGMPFHPFGTDTDKHQDIRMNRITQHTADPQHHVIRLLHTDNRPIVFHTDIMSAQ